MPIHIEPGESDCTVIPNSLAQNTELSLAARAVLVHILSMPEDWNPSDKNLKEFKIGSSILKRVRKELQESHYMYLEKLRDEQGHIRGKLWHVSNVPLTADEFDAMIKGAAPDHLPEDALINEQETEVAENKNEPAADYSMIDIGNLAETLPESPPEDERKDVQVKVVTENKDEITELDAKFDDKHDAPTNEVDPDPLPANQHEEVAENKDEITELDTTFDEKPQAQIEDADPDPLPASQHQEVTDNTSGTTEDDEAATQPEDPVVTPTESLAEDKSRDVQEQEAAESKEEPIEDINPAPQKKSPKKRKKKMNKTEKLAADRKKRKKVRC
jgi:hypothetical protein